MSELDRVADALYAAPPDGFVAARDAAVAEARAAGRAKDATALGRLRKPTVGAWLVNRLALTRPAVIGQLTDLAEQLRQAQRELAGDRVRTLSARRKDLLADLVAQAAELAVQAQPDTPAARLPLSEAEDSLAAALAEPDVAEQVRTGRLLRAVSYTGFGFGAALPDHPSAAAEVGADVEATDVEPAAATSAGNVIDINRRGRSSTRRDADAASPTAAGANRRAPEQSARSAQQAARGRQPARATAGAPAADREAPVRKAARDELADRRRRSEEEKRARVAARQELAAAQAELAAAADRLGAADRARQAASAELSEIEEALLALAERREQARAESVRAKAEHSAARRALVAAERRLTKAEAT
ncbi:hypothetical protein [Catellatospora tritici]|uniref:hypothetical protein n=1 Tax=Catellatospora tritici TaxID=2851566 RepID=UPI001C2DC4B1|nr:hypothetical protein [Catellatospora tritici]MBV1852758.1 hypothetical protein [Catellatospora tritici]